MSWIRRQLGRLLPESPLPAAGAEEQPPAAEQAGPFLLLGDLAGCRYVAENTLALLSGESVEVLHRLQIFDAEGRPVRRLERSSRRHFLTIDLGEEGPDLGSFLHSSHYRRSGLGPEAEGLLPLVPRHRGFCQYRRRDGAPWSGVAAGVAAVPRPLALGLGEEATLFVLNGGAAPARMQIVRVASEAGSRRAAPEVVIVPPRGVRCSRIRDHDGAVSFHVQRGSAGALVFLARPGEPDLFEVFAS